MRKKKHVFELLILFENEFGGPLARLSRPNSQVDRRKETKFGMKNVPGNSFVTFLG